MAVRNCAEIGENLQRIISRLMANDDLVKLLYYTDKDPLSQEALTDAEKTSEVFDKLIKAVPRVEHKENVKSIIAVRVVSGRRNSANNEFRDVTIAVETFVPFTQWYFKNTNLRPFAIMGEVQKSLDGKTINGLGKMIGGDFNLLYLTDEMACYEQTFSIIAYE